MLHAWQKLELSATSKGLGNPRFFGINMIQHGDCTIESNAEEKLESITQYPIKKKGRKEYNEKLNQLETSKFTLVNSSLG